MANKKKESKSALDSRGITWNGTMRNSLFRFEIKLLHPQS